MEGPRTRSRLLETQARLSRALRRRARHRAGHGAGGAPGSRAVLARRNGLEYVAWADAGRRRPGQRLLDDAVREHAQGGGPHALAPGHPGRVHSPLALAAHPPSAVRPHRPAGGRAGGGAGGRAAAALRGLRGHQPVQDAAGAAHGLFRWTPSTRWCAGATRWESFNTDSEGARAVLERLGATDGDVLGDGGSTAGAALWRTQNTGCRCGSLQARGASEHPLSGDWVWTWPDRWLPPKTCASRGARVAVIAYGAPGRRVAAEIRSPRRHPAHAGRGVVRRPGPRGSDNSGRTAT